MKNIIVKTWITLILYTSLSVLINASEKTPDASPDTNNEIEEKTTTTGFIQELLEPRVHKGKDRSGKEVYEFRCKGCHARNTQGAPMPDDNFDWAMRLKENGLKLMLKHSMEGYKNQLMPPKGGCRNCNQEEVYAAVFYMLKRSGNGVLEMK